jgi:hypothetical protein
VPNLFGNLPGDTLLDTAILYRGAVPYGVSRGGLAGTIEKEWSNVDFDGKRSPIVGLDRIVGVTARFSGVFIEFGPQHIQFYQALATGSLSAGSGAPSLTVAAAAALTVAVAAALTSAAIGVPEKAGTLMRRGLYTPDLRLVFLRAGGGDVRYVFPMAICDKWDLKGKDKSTAEISAQFTARLDLTVAADADVMPYILEVR